MNNPGIVHHLSPSEGRATVAAARREPGRPQQSAQRIQKSTHIHIYIVSNPHLRSTRRPTLLGQSGDDAWLSRPASTAHRMEAKRGWSQAAGGVAVGPPRAISPKRIGPPPRLQVQRTSRSSRSRNGRRGVKRKRTPSNEDGYPAQGRPVRRNSAIGPMVFSQHGKSTRFTDFVRAAAGDQDRCRGRSGEQFVQMVVILAEFAAVVAGADRRHVVGRGRANPAAIAWPTACWLAPSTTISRPQFASDAASIRPGRAAWGKGVGG